MFQPQVQSHETYQAQPIRWRDLPDVWTFENQAYGADNVSFETLQTWWWRYSRMGLHVRDAFGRVVATFDAMPLERQAFQAIVSGGRDEAELDRASIRPPRPGDVTSYWCITTLATDPPPRSRSAVLHALLGG